MRSAFLRCGAAVFLVAVFAAAGAQSVPLPGRNFLVLDAPRPASPPERIEVIEFFFYGCPVCYESQPHIAGWRDAAKADVLHIRLPSATSEGAENFALTFYALQASGHLERLHGAVYENHHFDDLRLDDEARLLEWLARNGVDAEAFRRLRGSSEVRSRVAAGRGIYELYKVRAVPAFVVDGRYLTSARLAGGVREMMDVVAYLVDRARQERSAR